MDKKQVVLGEYTYKKGTKVEIEGELLIRLMNFARLVKIENTQHVWPLNVPTKVGLQGLEFKKETTEREFFAQKPFEALSQIGVEALGMEYILCRTHEENIEAGKALHKNDIIQFTPNTHEPTTNPTGNVSSDMDEEPTPGVQA